MSSKGKRTFWIANIISELHQRRALLLQQSGFDVTFASTPSEVITKLKDGRPLCILMDSPSGNNPADIFAIQKLIRDPELNGVRFIASLTHDCPENHKTGSFRTLPRRDPYATA